PKNPRAELAPASVRAVGKDAHDGIEECVPEPRPKENGGCGARAQPEDVRVKVRLEKDHCHEDEVRGGVGGAVAGFFQEGKFLGRLSHAKIHFATVKVTFCKSQSRDESPIMISNSPGSTTSFIFRS